LHLTVEPELQVAYLGITQIILWRRTGHSLQHSCIHLRTLCSLFC